MFVFTDGMKNNTVQQWLLREHFWVCLMLLITKITMKLSYHITFLRNLHMLNPVVQSEFAYHVRF